MPVEERDLPVLAKRTSLGGCNLQQCDAVGEELELIRTLPNQACVSITRLWGESLVRGKRILPRRTLSKVTVACCQDRAARRIFQVLRQFLAQRDRVGESPLLKSYHRHENQPCCSVWPHGVESLGSAQVLHREVQFGGQDTHRTAHQECHG